MINTFNFQIAIILSIIEKNGRKSEHIFSQTQYYIGMEYRIRKIYGTIDKFPSHLPPPPPFHQIFPLYSKSYIFVLFAQLYQGLWQGVSDILHPMDLSLSQNIKDQLTCTQRNEAWIIHCT